MNITSLQIAAITCCSFFFTTPCGALENTPQSTTIETLEFNRDIRPILSDHCFSCHGPDASHRQAELRLDQPDSSQFETLFGNGVTPGTLEGRITTEDGDLVMPPKETGKPLSAEQKQLLLLWIQQGAKYQKHWSFEPAKKVALLADSHPIDQLISIQLAKHRAVPTGQADKRTLIRRLYLDLIGLPPTPEQVQAFVQSTRSDAYEQLVDSLLNRPEFGERMAMSWLDAVRFADTIGYHSDTPRNVWPYRDYVINSFNNNKPFDQFTIEQIAGDFLPDPSQEMLIATAFNRLLLTTEEGGAQAKDYEQRMLTDRVRAIGTVWLGLTTGCAQCHDHKFDPFSTKDFYALGAFFADIEEPIIGAREAGMSVFSEDARSKLSELEANLHQLRKEWETPPIDLPAELKVWESELTSTMDTGTIWQPLLFQKAHAKQATVDLRIESEQFVRATAREIENEPTKSSDQEEYVLEFDIPNAAITAIRIDAIAGENKKVGLASNGNFVLNEVEWNIGEEKLTFSNAASDFEQNGFNAANTIDGKRGKGNGWAVLGKTEVDHSLILRLTKPIARDDQQPLQPRVGTLKLHFQWGSFHSIANMKMSFTSSQKDEVLLGELLPNSPLEQALCTPEGERTELQRNLLIAKFKKTTPSLQTLRNRLAECERNIVQIRESAPKCLVTHRTQNKRTVRILPRGDWMDENGPIVKPALPEFFVPSQDGDREMTRLDLAKWIVDPNNPLTSRTIMNRLWRQFFGMGLSKVLDDLGMQGEMPPNPQLLDWLAVEFVESGWDIKHMVHLVVTSDAYKRSSGQDRWLLEMDPENRWLARQSNFRIDAELVRDSALSVSGLLVRKTGGPSVKPYQPEGYWENLNFPPRSYPTDHGENQYRRGLYTWWQRSFPNPSLIAFDAPTREECAAERNRSNTPQQALILLNDPTYVEAAKGLALRTLTECSGDSRERVRWCWNQVLQREPDSMELETTLELLQRRLESFHDRTEQAKKLLQVGDLAIPEDKDPRELAAWTHVARVLLNLHETVTRP